LCGLTWFNPTERQQHPTNPPKAPGFTKLLLMSNQPNLLKPSNSGWNARLHQKPAAKTRRPLQSQVNPKSNKKSRRIDLEQVWNETSQVLQVLQVTSCPVASTRATRWRSVAHPWLPRDVPGRWRRPWGSPWAPEIMGFPWDDPRKFQFLLSFLVWFGWSKDLGHDFTWLVWFGLKP